MNKGWIILKKKEMTRLWLDDKHVVVTLLQIIPQEIVRYKTLEKDGYNAVVVGAEKKDLKKEKGIKVAYSMMTEFKVTDEFSSAHAAGSVLDLSTLEGVTQLEIEGTSKGKGYQGAMKRFHLAGGPETHGSKFHRHIGSLGNRKPRRVQKGHPHAGHMGNETVTLKRMQIVNVFTLGSEQIVAVKGSIPGGYNGFIKAEIL